MTLEPAVAPPPRRRRPRRRWIHPLLLLLTLATMALSGGWNWDPPELPAGAIDPGWSQVLRWIVVAGLPYAFWLFLILGAHEMGHYLACRYYRIPATLPFFIPGLPPIGTFGAVIRIRGPIPHRKALFDVAAAGPIAGFAVAVPVLAVGMLRAEPFEPAAAEYSSVFGTPLLVSLLGPLWTGEGPIRANGLIGAGWVGMLVTSLNLFPVGQLDGGHAVYAISRRAHRVLARATLLGMLTLILVQIFTLGQFPAYLLWFGVLLVMRDRHPALLDETAPLGAGRLSVAIVLLVIFVLSFIPVPFRL